MATANVVTQVLFLWGLFLFLSFSFLATYSLSYLLSFRRNKKPEKISISIYRNPWPYHEKMGHIHSIHIHSNKTGSKYYFPESTEIWEDETGIEYDGKYLEGKNAKRVWESGYKNNPNLRKFLIPIIKEEVDKEYRTYYPDKESI